MKLHYLLLVVTATAANAQYLTPQLAADPGGILNGTTFVNNGLVGAGRLSGNTVDSFGETFGAASGLSISNFISTGGNSFSGTFNILPDRGFNKDAAGPNPAFFSNYAARIHQVGFTFTPYTGVAPVGQTQIVTSYNPLAPNATTKFTYNDGVTTKFTTGLVPDTFTNSLFGNLVGTKSAA
ncbi:MAG: hypothetical protein H7Y36_10005, partial [Armatimonadetes bacterium]|nr:hypothetical protein [Akkermansiaceae bacterium]